MFLRLKLPNFSPIIILNLFYFLLLTGCTENESNEKNYHVFRYNQSEGLTSLDPAFARNQANIWAQKQLFNGLLELNEQMEVAPAIAHSWDIAENGLVYTFHLRDDVYFHPHKIFKNKSSRHVTASDFVYSFRRILNKQTASTGAWIFNDKVLRDAEGNISDTCFKAVNPYTLKIYLQKPFPPFPELLTMPYAYVVPKKIIKHYGKDFRVHPVGTGPFRFKTWEENSSLIFSKYEEYWRKDKSGHQLPYLDAVQITFVSDKNMELYNFKKHKLDFMSSMDDNVKDKIINDNGKVKKTFKTNYQVTRIPYLNTEYIGFQLDSSKYDRKNHPLLNPKVRKALSYAIDRRTLLKYIRKNIGKEGHYGIVPPWIKQFDHQKTAGYKHNIKKAYKLLKEAGYPGGEGFPTLQFNSNPPYRKISEFLQKNWSELGIDVKLDINNFATHQEMVDNGRVNFFRGAWLGDYPDAENYLSLFYSKNFAPAGPNKTHFHSQKFDSLYNKALHIHNKEKRYRIYEKMDQLIMKKCPVIILFYDQVLRMTQQNISGLPASPMNRLDLEKVKKQ